MHTFLEFISSIYTIYVERCQLHKLVTPDETNIYM